MSTDNVVVITGASSGIGAALAQQLGSQGHKLVLAARRERELGLVAAPFGVNALPVVTDVRRRSDVERLRDHALAEFGRVDVWVNNVGRGIVQSVLTLSDEELDEIFAVNLKSALYGMQAIVPHYQQRGKGHLINISSFLGRVPLVPVRSAYNAAKAALNSLTANLRMELAKQYPGIHVSLVMPGIVATDFPANALGGAPVAGWPSSGPMKAQTADEVAAVLVALIEHPVAEVYTNPAQKAIVERYYHDVAAFEESGMPAFTPPTGN